MKVLTVQGTPKGEYLTIRSGRIAAGVMACWADVLSYGLNFYFTQFDLDEQAAKNLETEIEDAQLLGANPPKHPTAAGPSKQGAGGQ